MSSRSLSEEFLTHVRAGFSGLWVRSDEQEEALAMMRRAAVSAEFDIRVFDMDRGWQTWQQTATADGYGLELRAVQPLDMDLIKMLKKVANPEEHFDRPLILVVRNLSHALIKVELLSTVFNLLYVGKTLNRYLVALVQPHVAIPTELERHMVPLDHPLPTAEVLGKLLEDPTFQHDPAQRQQIVDAALGLTQLQAENAFALSLIRQGRRDANIVPKDVWDSKATYLKKLGLQIYAGDETFDSLGGLTHLKAFCKRAIEHSHPTDPNRMAKGVMMAGVPGAGKSAFAKALGNETGRRTIIMDLGAMRGSLQGQTEERIRQALSAIDAMGKVVVLLDEVEKSLSGTSGSDSGKTDGGTGSRMLGTLLTWLNDHQSGAFLICTANDVTALPPEFSRAERFDGIFFVDLPTPEEAQLIWKLYLTMYDLGLNREPADQPDAADWTGAEIRSCCRLADLLEEPLKQAAEKVVPVAVTAGNRIEALRQWAQGRCLSASYPGIYDPQRSSRQRPSVGSRKLLNK